jgi:hypothetical protein
MSQENLDVVRAALDAYNRGDFERAFSFAASDCTFDWSRSIGPHRGVYGIDEVSQFNIAEQFESTRNEPRTHLHEIQLGWGPKGRELKSRRPDCTEARFGTAPGPRHSVDELRPA